MAGYTLFQDMTSKSVNSRLDGCAIGISALYCTFLFLCTSSSLNQREFFSLNLGAHPGFAVTTGGGRLMSNTV